jgi:DNA-binding response OmpR family regulator
LPTTSVCKIALVPDQFATCSRRKILVVDDEPANVALLKRFLEAKGYEVVTARDGEEALQRVREESPSMVLLDVQMPRKDGLETLREISRQSPNIAVIMVSGADDGDVGPRALLMGASDFIVKPLDLTYLENVLSWTLQTQGPR